MKAYFIILLLLVKVCQCNEEALGYYPVLLTNNLQYRYFSLDKNYKLVSKGAKVKRIRVYDDMECAVRCTRMGDLCRSANYKKKDTDGLHLCELIMTDNNEPEALVSMKNHDQAYQHISAEVDPLSSAVKGWPTGVWVNSGTNLLQQKPIHKSCAEVYKNNGRRNAVYNIVPTPPLSLYIYCDMKTDGGGWTVIQKRLDGSVDFYRDWNEYKRGFGNKLGEYWLGLDNIHAMTSQADYELRIDMEDFDGNTRYAEYEYFKVADESDNYRLRVEGYLGNASDSLTYHDGWPFSTKDRDNDKDANSACARTCKGAWWYKKCHECNPNGPYVQYGRNVSNCLGIVWNGWLGSRYSLKRFEMKIRRV